MFGEYGYMEEGQLGKPYNFKLLKRLSKYAFPYRKTVLTALFLTILITFFELAIPYLTKIAIDRYILSSWYRMDIGELKGSEAKDFTKKYGHLLRKSKDRSQCYISNLDLKNLDPADLHDYKARKILTSERLYRIGSEVGAEGILEKKIKAIHELDDGSKLIPYELLNSFSKKDILKIRIADVRGVALVSLILILFLVFAFVLSFGELPPGIHRSTYDAGYSSQALPENAISSSAFLRATSCRSLSHTRDK